MDLQLTPVDGVTLPRPSIRILAVGPDLGVYWAATQATPGAAPGARFQTVLTAVKVGSSNPLTPPQIVVPQLLPNLPSWDLSLATGGGTLAITRFGGGWNALRVDTLANGQLVPGYVYSVEDSTALNFVRNTGAGASQQEYVSAILSGYQLAVIGLQAQDDRPVPAVTGIVGSSTAPVAAGRVFGDLTQGLPASLGVAYLQRTQVGPLAPNGLFTGGLRLASFATKTASLGPATELLPGIAVSQFDLAVLDSYLCVLATTGGGAPVLALFDATGKPQGTSNLPAGPWTNPGHWVASPSIVSTATGFAFAFVDMDGPTPAKLYVGTLTSPTP